MFKRRFLEKKEEKHDIKSFGWKIKSKKKIKFENTQSNIQSKIRFYCSNIDLLLNKNRKWLLNFVKRFRCTEIYERYKVIWKQS